MYLSKLQVFRICMIFLIYYIHASGPLQQKPIIRDNEDGTYDVTYTPNPEGALLTANVLYNGHQVPDR